VRASRSIVPTRRNALSIALRDEVSDALDELAADETIKSVVVTGAGDVFSADSISTSSGAPSRMPSTRRRCGPVAIVSITGC